MVRGEQALLPAVRHAEQFTVIVADGFSRKFQIEQTNSGRGALHVAQVMKIAREHGRRTQHGGSPESGYNHVRPKAGHRAQHCGSRHASCWPPRMPPPAGCATAVGVMRHRRR